ncbi:MULTISPECIES: hypothetical protein [Bradyrhizobium]|uniref:Uncharacterized protein n=2 Tax=Bradyrhizobium TaxID=374 RepID=A0A939M0L7_9BRAD|nr:MULTISPECIES: hypothetical protein [Bradyrhizobium]MBR0882718.1 hypothetical protein [Bradyrhizobium liaoningense]MBR1003631.1 hypothetical protein [Bradyrhizobium liaoningense]UEM13724.1 hypothetical protein J4G43_005290 [Bradyrhizobium barranii subsp. barranii]
MDMLSTLFALVGYVVVGVGAVGAFVWWLFRTFSEKWLNAKFEERLAAYKHEQQKELEHLKFEINAQMDRATKLHQKEFEALPEAWARLMDAHGMTVSLVSRYQSHPDLNRMRPDQLEDFIVHSKLAEWQRQLVRDADDKTNAYRNQIEPFKIARTRKASRKFYLYFRKNGIFIREPIKQKFEALDQLMLSAMSEHEMNFQHKTREFKSIDRLASDGEKMVKALEGEVQKRLWDSTRQETDSSSAVSDNVISNV